MPPATANTLLDWALLYANLDFTVIPFEGKVPAVAWKKYQKTSPTKEDLRRWFSHSQYTNMGFVTGKYWVLDIDVKNGRHAVEKFEGLAKEQGLITPMVRTPSGGLHVYFAHSDDLRVKTQANSARGIDVRADGACAVVPPSTHPATGTPYEWIYSPETTPLAATPEWVLDFIGPKVDAKTADMKRLPDGRWLDGREWIMTCLVWAYTMNAARQGPTPPNEDETVEAVWSDCEKRIAPRTSSLDAEGRGKALLRAKIKYALSEPRWLKAREQAQAEADAVNAHSDNKPVSNVANALALLEANPLSEVFAFNEMTREIFLLMTPADPQLEPGAPRPLKDADLIAVQVWLQRRGLRSVAKNTVDDAILLLARRNAFHPVRIYLTSLDWDRVCRLDSWLHLYLGADQTQYSAVVGRMFLISMIARAMEPGCKVDHLLVLEGPQGCGKSRACKILGGEWFSDSLRKFNDKDTLIHIGSSWLIEIAELAAFRGGDNESLKSFLTQTTDRFRPPYGKTEVENPRQCAFIGTTNNQQPLTDPTGSRRFWPVRVKKIDDIALEHDRNKLLAEAVAAFLRGDKWYPDETFERECIIPEQERRRQADPWEEPIADFLKNREFASTGEIQMCLGLELARMGSRDMKRLVEIMQRLGWEPHRTSQSRGWRRLPL